MYPEPLESENDVSVYVPATPRDRVTRKSFVVNVTPSDQRPEKGGTPSRTARTATVPPAHVCPPPCMFACGAQASTFTVAFVVPHAPTIVSVTMSAPHWLSAP